MSDELLDYAAWGERFFATAVTAERVLGGVNVLAGRPIDVGPMGVGPGRIAKVSAQGQIGTATGTRVSDNPAVFQVDLPVRLEFTIDLGMDKLRFDAAITVPLRITAHARADLAIVLELTPPTATQVACRLNAQGIRATLTGKAANVEGELKRFVAKYVTKELNKAYVRDATVIDVGAAIDRAAQHVGPREPNERSTMAEELTDDLPGAMKTELEQTAHLFIDSDPELTAHLEDTPGVSE
ncbi:MAG: hypothetical protein L0H31_08490 [Nocardioidaceae bacterium]|nr:hypothetical protein [Nocardioidaceae bacterium]